MAITVDKDLCIGCGTCVAVCPQSFQIGSEGKSEPVSQEISDCARSAESSCPVQAIAVA